MKTLLQILQDLWCGEHLSYHSKKLMRGSQKSYLVNALLDDKQAIWKNYSIPKPSQKESKLAVATFVDDVLELA